MTWEHHALKWKLHHEAVMQNGVCQAREPTKLCPYLAVVVNNNNKYTWSHGGLHPVPPVAPILNSQQAKPKSLPCHETSHVQYWNRSCAATHTDITVKITHGSPLCPPEWLFWGSPRKAQLKQRTFQRVIPKMSPGRVNVASHRASQGSACWQGAAALPRTACRRQIMVMIILWNNTFLCLRPTPQPSVMSLVSALAANFAAFPCLQRP